MPGDISLGCCWAASLAPGGQEVLDPLWVSLEDQRSWAWIFRMFEGILPAQLWNRSRQGCLRVKLCRLGLAAAPDKAGKEGFITAELQWCSAVGERDEAQLWLRAQGQAVVSGRKMTSGGVRAGGCLLDQLRRKFLEAGQGDQIPSVGAGGGFLFNDSAGFLLKPAWAGQGQGSRLEPGQKEDSEEPIQVWSKRASLSESDKYLLFWVRTSCHTVPLASGMSLSWQESSFHSNSGEDLLCFALTKELGPKFWMNPSSSLEKWL